MNENTRKYIREVSEQVAMALTSNKTPEPVKDCLKTIIFEASTEADLTISDFSLIGDALPNVIEKLPIDYGRGFLHSIAAIVRHDTPAFQNFYDNRLDEKPMETAQPEPKQTTENDMKDEIKLNRNEIITHEEIELLVYSLILDAEFHPYAIYGLMFLFGSIKKSLEAGRSNNPDIENICLSALLKLYSLSENGYEAIERATKHIHIPYRAADFKTKNQRDISEAFIKSECFESAEKVTVAISDISEQSAKPENETESLNDLANQFAAIMNNPHLPRDIYNVLTDEFARIQSPTATPENILLNLQALQKAKRKQQEAKNA